MSHSSLRGHGCIYLGMGGYDSFPCLSGCFRILDWGGADLGYWDIATKEVMAINKMLWFCRHQVCNARVDALVNDAMKVLFATTAELNALLCLSYVRSAKNPADGPSHHRSSSDCRLTDNMWKNVQREFGGSEDHTFDLMSLDSNM